MANRYSISTVFSAVDNMTRPVRRMAGSISNMTQSVESGLRDIDAATSRLSSSLFSVGKTAATGIAGITSAAIVGASAINGMQAETENMARAMGANINTVEAVASGIRGIGLDAEAVTDLYEEMNNKFGESAGIKELGPVTESLGILGLEFGKLKKLSPDEQFRAITDAALKMEDATQAQAAADILMGAEANKIIGTLRLQGKSMDDIIKNHEMLSFRTEKSRQGASAMAAEQAKTTKIMSSMGKEISGLIGSALTPLIEKFNTFMVNNKELISQNMSKLFDSIAGSVGDVGEKMGSLMKWVGNLGANFNKFVEMASLIGKIALAVGGLLLTLKIFIGVMTAVNLVMSLNPAGMMILGINAAIIAIGALTVAIYSNWDGITDYFGGIWDSITQSFNDGIAFIQNALAWSPIDAVTESWGGLTDYFSGLFGGISEMYESTLGSVMNGINSVGDFFSSDDEDAEVNKSMTIDTNNVVTPQERISKTITESREDFNINVHGQGGAQLSTPQYSPRLNLINTGD